MAMTTAFVLRNITTVNYYLYQQDFPIKGAGNAVFLGGNGSGKSVLLDAIQIVMTGMNKRYLDLNSRIATGRANRRTILEACLGLLDDGQGYERESCITYIALGFETTDATRRCTAGVCIEAKAAAGEAHVLGLFFVGDTILRRDDFVDPVEGGFQEKPWASFLDEQRRQRRDVQTFQRQNNRAFLRHLYATINANARGTQLDPDRARAAMRQALSFDIGQITSVTTFVQSFLLDEAPIEIETFQARYNTWRDMQKDIARIEAEIRTVESIRTQCERVMSDQFNARLWAYGEKRAEYDRFSQIIDKQVREIAEMEEQLASIESFLPKLEDYIEVTRRQIDAITQQIGGTPAYEQIKRAQSERVTQESKRKAKAIEARSIHQAFIDLREATSSIVFPREDFSNLVGFVRTLHSREVIQPDAASWPPKPRDVAELLSEVPPLSNVIGHIQRAHEEVTGKHAQLSRETADLDRNLSNLRAGGRMMSRDTQDFLEDLSRLGMTCPTLSEVADIAPQYAEWRGIIEAILGDWCDAAIVDPSLMDSAYSHFDNHYKGTKAKLIQTENLPTGLQAPTPGTLAEAVITDDQYARAFINVRLGRIVRARSANDIRRGDLAASTDGKYAHGRGIEYRRLQAVPRLGKAVRERQIEHLTEARAELEAPLRRTAEEKSRLQALVAALERANSILGTDREDWQETLRAIDETDVETARLDDLISALEQELPSGLMEEKRSLEEELQAYLAEKREEGMKERNLREQIGHRRGGMEANRTECQKAAELLLSRMPNFELRKARHDPPLGLERFMGRVRSIYRDVNSEFSHPAHVRNHFAAQSKDKGPAQRAAVTRLMSAIQDYVQANPDQHPGFDWTDTIHAEKTVHLHDWASLRQRHLTQTVLRQFKDRVDSAVKALVETMVHDFLSRLRANIDTVRRVQDDLNRELRRSVFMGEVYQIRQERDQDKETIRYLIDRLDVIAPKATALMQSAPDPNDPDQVKINELIEMLTAEDVQDEAAHRRRLRELADYRNYFRFSIDICDPEKNYDKISDLETRRGKASGGQKFLPFYICLGVASSAAYRNHLGGAHDAPPQSALLLMDEAFEKLDPENIYKIISFYKALGLQLVMAAPKTHQALYQETFDTLTSIIRVGRRIQATPQHMHAPAHEILRLENPMHKPRTYFEEVVRNESYDAAK
ncbi:SbcC/MukB-like Walker B domain-containing protein [Tepidicaulis sp. LMO-SS28]|uniref:SbcC/MukB-like Walker B domain-containing protein n=1 Tax=Tepidicaulis sp. LMO-SS28 TaxID=3447455 RepID=UPI003EE29C2D